jgi:hypothetical protein
MGGRGVQLSFPKSTTDEKLIESESESESEEKLSKSTPWNVRETSESERARGKKKNDSSKQNTHITEWVESYE